jgi:hypothetical protein
MVRKSGHHWLVVTGGTKISATKSHERDGREARREESFVIFVPVVAEIFVLVVAATWLAVRPPR